MPDPDALLKKQQKKIMPRAGYNVVKEDYSKNILTEDDRLRLALTSTMNYNKRLLEDRIKTEQMILEVGLADGRLRNRDKARSTASRTCTRSSSRTTFRSC